MQGRRIAFGLDVLARSGRIGLGGALAENQRRRDYGQQEQLAGRIFK